MANEPLDINLNALMQNLGIEAKQVETVRSTCAQCGKKFSWAKKGKGPAAAKVYCSDECIALMRAEKKKRRQAANSKQIKPIECYFINKILFPNGESAWAFIDERFPDDDKISPYRCRCGGIHIGHPKSGKKKRNNIIPRPEPKMQEGSEGVTDLEG